jgi:parallel beta-helix repeat protein
MKRKVWASHRGRIPTFIPKLQALEDRTLLAVLVVSPGGSVPGSFSSIQAAVNNANAAGGDTIQVEPGKYTEQVMINKSLTIEGNGAGAIIQAPASLATVLGQTPLVEIGGGAAVNMSNLTLDGPGPSAGIYVVGGATANVTGTTIAHMRNNPLNGVQTGRGILVGSTGQNQVGHAVITGCTITDYQKSGIVTGGNGTTVTITGTTITGVGPTSLIAQNGININPGTTAQVSNNTISGNEYTGQGSGPDPTMNTQSAGILNFNDGGSFTGNTVFGNDEGIFSTNTGSTATTISGNTVHNNRFQGILLAEGTATVSNNTITGNNIGVAVRASVGDSVNAQGTLISNNITNNGNGVLVPPFPGGGIVLLKQTGATTRPVATAHFNRIFGNSVGLDNSRVAMAATVDATNNWWGSNNGPGGAGSDTVKGPVTFNPWLVVQVTAFPTSVLVGGVAIVIADLTHNSKGTDTSALGHLPDGVPILFGATLGTVAPAIGATAAGKGETQFTAGNTPGLAMVSAKVDNHNTCTAPILVNILPPIISPTLEAKVALLASNMLTATADAIFINHLYQDLLGRAPDLAGLNGWDGLLLSGVPREQVAEAIWQSPEHRGLEVDRDYLLYLHRPADPLGRQAWVNAFLMGASENQVALGFLTSGEFMAEHPDDSSFVSGLYFAVLGRSAGASEIAGWQQALQNGLSRAGLAQMVLASPEADLRLLDQYYQSYLGRPADMAAQQAWLPLLENGVLTPAAVAEAILASDEFFARAS